MARSLSRRGGNVIGHAGFIVRGKEGPLQKGMLNQAGAWINQILDLVT